MARQAARGAAVGAAVALLTAVSGLGTPARAAEPGKVIWSDLVSEDAEAAASFYTALFGWRVEERAPGVMRLWLADREIGAIHQINDSMPNAKESTWLVGVAVPDLEAAVAATRGAGGEVLRPVTEVPGDGRFAVVRDPRGAVLGLVEPARELGGARGVGAPVWAELWTDDRDAAATFYAAALGYERQQLQLRVGPYDVLARGGTPRAGLVATPSASVKPAWVPYVAVADLSRTLTRSRELGGRVLLEPRPEFAGGRVALIEDPTGGALFVVQAPPEEKAP
jgi:uncharacterized protein